MIGENWNRLNDLCLLMNRFDWIQRVIYVIEFDLRTCSPSTQRPEQTRHNVLLEVDHFDLD